VAREFAAAVAQTAEGTPYVVTPTEQGFDVGLNVVDAEWFGLLSKAGLRKTCVHHVRVRESDRSFSITDDLRTVEWVAGVPGLSGSAEVVRGRVIEFGAAKVWAFDEHGDFGVQADYRFGSQEGRDLIEGVAQQLELSSRRGLEERIGIGFALFAVGGLVIGGLVVLVLLALGRL
jgi:hypothetical protein